jgi:hypothetical protein
MEMSKPTSQPALGYYRESEQCGTPPSLTCLSAWCFATCDLFLGRQRPEQGFAGPWDGDSAFMLGKILVHNKRPVRKVFCVLFFYGKTNIPKKENDECDMCTILLLI